MASLRAPCVRAPQAILAERRSRARAGMARGAPPSTHACGIFQQATASGHPREDCDSPWLPTRPFCTLQSTWFARQGALCALPQPAANRAHLSCIVPEPAALRTMALCMVQQPAVQRAPRRASRKRPLRARPWPSAPCNRACLFSSAPSAPCTRPACATTPRAHRAGGMRRVLHLPARRATPSLPGKPGLRPAAALPAPCHPAPLHRAQRDLARKNHRGISASAFAASLSL